MSSGHALTADSKVLAFHKDTYVFDGLSIAYVLDEKYSERLVAGGVDGTNVTFALEEDWDTALRKAEQYLTKIEKNPYLKLCLTAGDLRAARQGAKSA
jgi:microsomal dipeptidase-like Zn-dependent dipeptidase